MSNEKYSISATSVHAGTIFSQRIENPKPLGIRWLRRRDGVKVLQFAFQWTCGAEAGIEWRDVPTVMED